MSVQDIPAAALTREEVARLIEPSAFHKLFGIDVIEVATEPEGPRLTLSVKLAEHLERQPATHQWHGGAIAAAVDITGCYTLGLLTGGPPPTVNFRTDYLRPAMTASLTLTGRVRRAGRSVGVVDVDVIDASDRLVAVGRGCFSLAGSYPAESAP